MIRVVKKDGRLNSHFYGRKPLNIDKELLTYVKTNQKYWILSDNDLSSKSSDGQATVDLSKSWIFVFKDMVQGTRISNASNGL